MPSRSKRIFFGDYVFLVDENVYEPAEDSFLFAENLDVDEEDWVLDMGTGCGILGILAAARARGVVAVDINPYAVRCARDNAKVNNVRANMVFVRSDLLTGFSEIKFDVVLFNAPYLPTEPNEGTSWLERAWTGGATGRQIIDRFVDEVPVHLKRSGRVLLMQSTLAGVDETVHRLAERGLKTRVVAEQVLPFFERVVLLEAGS
ncbi:methyltransferase [Candidatus Bathyarchaeota archaeon A05DMB-2]|jgi:release factor glutamine methyltransferase|nr:methyltransferase [Candidatus Bathyarchaeota archaeon A05DMB-2]